MKRSQRNIFIGIIAVFLIPIILFIYVSMTYSVEIKPEIYKFDNLTYERLILISANKSGAEEHILYFHENTDKSPQNFNNLIELGKNYIDKQEIKIQKLQFVGISIDKYTSWDKIKENSLLHLRFDSLHQIQSISIRDDGNFITIYSDFDSPCPDTNFWNDLSNLKYDGNELELLNKSSISNDSIMTLSFNANNTKYSKNIKGYFEFANCLASEFLTKELAIKLNILNTKFNYHLYYTFKNNSKKIVIKGKTKDWGNVAYSCDYVK